MCLRTKLGQKIDGKLIETVRSFGGLSRSPKLAIKLVQI
jgi:hypothetical protein